MDLDKATFLGYEEVKLDRDINGKKSVKVKCLPVRKLPEYASLFSLEPEIIALCTDLKSEEIDMLMPSDSGKIFRKAHELNYIPFSEWLHRKEAAVRMQAQIYEIDLPPEKIQSSGEIFAKG